MRMRIVAGAELVLIAPSALFMIALLVRALGRADAEPARAAQAIVMAYAGQLWTLWILLIGLPLLVLVTGGAAVLGTWLDAGRQRPPANAGGGRKGGSADHRGCGDHDGRRSDSGDRRPPHGRQLSHATEEGRSGESPPLHFPLLSSHFLLQKRSPSEKLNCRAAW